MNFFKKRIYLALVLFIAVILVGVIGYMVISEETFINALYMTIITMSTVGFGELHPLNDQEKIFTIFLILTSIIVYAYTVSAITEYITSGQFFERIKNKKVQQKLQQLENHTIVCGYGRNGKQAVIKLKKHDKQCLVIEKDKLLIEELESDDILFIEGDATTDEPFENAKLDKAHSLITALPSDADNLFVVLSTRQLNKNITIISRASDESSYNKLKIAGADNVIMPDKLGGDHMASLVVTPDLIEFVDRLTIEGECTTNLREISVNDLPKEYNNKTILDLDLRRKTGCNVIGFVTNKSEYIINPDPSTHLLKDTNLIVLGNSDQIQKLKDLFE